MELRHLRYFIAVAEEENVTRAAARLHVAQPALSRQIRDFEQALGVPLFDHTARTVRLNAAGRHFLDEAREVVDRFEKAVASVRAFANGQEEEFHLGYAPSLTIRMLPRVLREFQTACPEVRVRLHDLSTEEMLAGLREGWLRAALLVKPSTPALEGLVYKKITPFRGCVALPLGHRLATGSELTSASLAGEPLVTYSLSHYPEYRAWLARIFRGGKHPRIAVECDSASSLITAVEAGGGVAVVQEGFENLVGGRLAVRTLNGPDEACFSFGVAHRRDDLTTATRGFVDVLFSRPAAGEDPPPPHP